MQKFLSKIFQQTKHSYLSPQQRRIISPSVKHAVLSEKPLNPPIKPPLNPNEAPNRLAIC
jgi:hypothetical protein